VRTSHKKVPCWHFEANRPRAGKDYLAGVSQIVYLGETFEDAAIGDQAEETRKRITSALVSGRRQMHFANCQVYLDDQYFIQAITNTTFRARMLGATTAESDLELPNEIEFSFSGNMGLTWKEDLTPRCRRISLEYFEEDENSRVFDRTDLHGMIKRNRSQILSAIAKLVQTWLDAGAPVSKNLMMSFPEWSAVVGGIMKFHGLGDPCLPQAGGALGGDRKIAAVTALYQHAFERDPNEWWTEKQVFNLISELRRDGEDDRMDFFGDLDDPVHGQKNRQITGQTFKAFSGRPLGGIKMEIDATSANVGRHRMRFFKP
jgi:hypothetical protein